LAATLALARGTLVGNHLTSRMPFFVLDLSGSYTFIPAKGATKKVGKHWGLDFLQSTYKI